MSEFKVKPKAVAAAGEDLETLGWSVYFVRNLMHQVRVAKAGTVISTIADALDDVRSDLEDAYAAGGQAERLLAGAGAAFKEVARDYRATDEAQRAEYDAKLKQIDGDPFIDTQYDDGGAGVEGFEYTRTFFVVPDSAFESYDQWIGIRDTIDSVLGFDWIDGPLEGLGLPAPIKRFAKSFDGDWAALGEALGALDLVTKYWRRVDGDLNGIAKQIPAFWTGNAADAAQEWLVECGARFCDHATGLSGLSSRISSEAYAMQEALRLVLGLLEDIVDLIPEPDGGIVDKIVETATTPVRLGKLYLKVMNVMFYLDVLMTAGHAIVAAFAQLNRFKDTGFPRVPGYDAPDVGGSAR